MAAAARAGPGRFLGIKTPRGWGNVPAHALRSKSKQRDCSCTGFYKAPKRKHG